MTSDFIQSRYWVVKNYVMYMINCVFLNFYFSVCIKAFFFFFYHTTPMYFLQYKNIEVNLGFGSERFIANVSI